MARNRSHRRGTTDTSALNSHKKALDDLLSRLSEVPDYEPQFIRERVEPDDRRFFNPTREDKIRDAVASRRPAPLTRYKPLAVPQFIRDIQDVRRWYVCKRRKLRRKMIFVLNRSGKGQGRGQGRRRPRRNEDSKYRC